MKFGKVLAAAAVLGVAGMAQAASITLTNTGNPVGFDGPDASLNVWTISAAKVGAEANINTLLMTVNSTGDLLHQVWAFGAVPTPNNTGFLAAPKLGFDTYIPDASLYSVTVTAANENRPTVGGSTDSAFAAGETGYGNQIGIEAAAPGAGLASTNILQLVIPSGLTQVVSGGDVVVQIELVQIGGQQTFATYHFAAAAPIPVPAAYPLGLAGLGLLAAVRRRIVG